MRPSRFITRAAAGFSAIANPASKSSKQDFETQPSAFAAGLKPETKKRFCNCLTSKQD